MAVLENNRSYTVFDPFRADLTCYQVLCAANDVRAADVLKNASGLLYARSLLIKDPELQHSFRHQVATNRALIDRQRVEAEKL